MRKTINFKRVLFVALALVMLVGTVVTGVIGVSAENSTTPTSGTWGGIDWVLSDDGTLTISPTDNVITKKKPWSGELYARGEVPAAVNDAISAFSAKITHLTNFF